MANAKPIRGQQPQPLDHLQSKSRASQQGTATRAASISSHGDVREIKHSLSSAHDEDQVSPEHLIICTTSGQRAAINRNTKYVGGFNIWGDPP
ncbi:hypothetical protein N7454_007053 [Penicillium verhagenii]|nr:hypothetical protein N7454_007053 [Penicillium verhagenii]